MASPIGTTAQTGAVCPESGVWRVQGTPSTTAPIAKGNRMPPYGGKASPGGSTSTPDRLGPRGGGCRGRLPGASRSSIPTADT